MPSCVVKCCRNNSNFAKKIQGITFHRFPRANEHWKDDWIEILRKSRNDKFWNPSTSSVVCSVHFEDKDLYTTKGGLLRVRLYAVPKKYLFESTASQDVQLCSPSLLTESSVGDAMVMGPNQQILLGQVSTTFSEELNIKVETDHWTTTSEEQILINQADFESDAIPSTSEQLKIKVETDPFDTTSGQQMLKTQADFQNTTLSSPNLIEMTPSISEQLNVKVETEPFDTTSEQQMLITQADFQNTTLSSPNLIEVTPSTSGQLSIKLEIDPESTISGQQMRITQADVHNTNLSSAMLIEVMRSTSGQQNIKEEDTDPLSTISKPDDINSSNNTSEDVHTSEATPNESDLEDLRSMLYTPRKRRLKEIILKMQTVIQNKNKRIKILNQKVRRLEKRNQSLKSILKTYKEINKF